MSRRHKATRAIHALRAAGAAFDEHPYDYVDGGGTATFAAQAGIDERSVIKTLVMADQHRRPLLVLMHGDHEVSTKGLVRLLQPVQVDVARD